MTFEIPSRLKIFACTTSLIFGDKWMLVTSCWGQFLANGDRILILVTSFECWCPTLGMKDRECWWRKRPKPSPRPQSCRQHISSPTSVTNIDVASPIWWLHLQWQLQKAGEDEHPSPTKEHLCLPVIFQQF